MNDLDFLREATDVPADAVRELRLRVLADVAARQRRRRLLWFTIPPAAAAALALSFALLLVKQPPMHIPQSPAAPPAPQISAVQALRPRPAAPRKPKPKPPVVMQLETADPDVVIYLVSSGGEE